LVDVAEIRAAVGAAQDPELHRSLDELGMVRDVRTSRNGTVDALIALTTPESPMQEELIERVTAAAEGVPGVRKVRVQLTSMSDEQRASMMKGLLGDAGREVQVGSPGSGTRIIAIASGKGGVGKSSVTANLGVALSKRGSSVGIIDADVWGFSIPKMLGIDRGPTVIEETLLPPEIYGVRVMSMDFFVRPDQAVVWRGPMLHKAMEQFLVDVFWDDPDYLLVDMPPGTGDIAISLSQFLPQAQAIVVTTPQITAQRVAKRAALMARKVEQEVLGVVENMSWFTGDDGTRYSIFGEGGGEALAAELEVPLLAKIPLLPAMREGADAGMPVAVVDPGSEAAAAFDSLAQDVEARRPRLRMHPELVIS
jgi:ATP-binding protein involved in chromosome partitioning